MPDVPVTSRLATAARRCSPAVTTAVSPCRESIDGRDLVHLPHEIRHEQIGGPLVDVARRPDLLDGAAVEDGDPVGQRHRLGLVVGHVDEGDAGAALQALQLGAHALAELGVEIGERLVEQQDGGLDDQRAAKRNALLLAAAELSGMPVLQPLEPDRRQNLVDAGFLVAPIELRVAQAEGDILQDRHVRPDGVVLEDHAHAPPLRRHDARSATTGPRRRR